MQPPNRAFAQSQPLRPAASSRSELRGWSFVTACSQADGSCRAKTRRELARSPPRSSDRAGRTLQMPTRTPLRSTLPREGAVNLHSISAGAAPPRDLNALIEIPLGGEAIKYETDKACRRSRNAVSGARQDRSDRHMTLAQLRIFVAAAERQHVTQAAAQLNLTRSDRVGDGVMRLQVLARQLIDPAAPPHPFVQSGRNSFDALLQSAPDTFAGRLLVCDTTMFSSTAGRGQPAPALEERRPTAAP